MKNGANLLIFYQKTVVKNFLKLLNETRKRDRILGSGPVKNPWSLTCKIHDPDLRTGLKVMWIGPDPDSRIRIQEFLCGPQIRIGSVPYRMDPLLRTIFMCEEYNLRHLVTRNTTSWIFVDNGIWWESISLKYHHFWSPERVRYGWSANPARSTHLEEKPECHSDCGIELEQWNNFGIICIWDSFCLFCKISFFRIYLC